MVEPSDSQEPEIVEAQDRYCTEPLLITNNIFVDKEIIPSPCFELYDSDYCRQRIESKFETARTTHQEVTKSMTTFESKMDFMISRLAEQDVKLG